MCIVKLLGVSNIEGVVVMWVSEGLLVVVVGIELGDVFIMFNGKLLCDSDELCNSEGLLLLGSEVMLGLLCEGKMC